jgi:hypothetical protein
MQIREQGRLIQCIRSTYDKDKGRSFQKVVATLKRWHSEVPTEGMDGLTDEEKQELAAWLAERQVKSQATDRAYAVSGASGSLDRIVQALAAGVEPSSAQAVAIWKGLTDLGKALRKAGHPKPKPAPKPIPVAPAAASKPAKPVRAAKPKQPATNPPSKARAARVAPSDAKPAASASPSKPDKSVSTPKGKGGAATVKQEG